MNLNDQIIDDLQAYLNARTAGFSNEGAYAYKTAYLMSTLSILIRTSPEARNILEQYVRFSSELLEEYLASDQK